MGGFCFRLSRCLFDLFRRYRDNFSLQSKWQACLLSSVKNSVFKAQSPLQQLSRHPFGPIFPLPMGEVLARGQAVCYKHADALATCCAMTNEVLSF